LHWHQGSSEESSSVTPSYPRQSSAAIITIVSLTRRSGHPISLALKIPGPKGSITVQGSFEVFNTCDKEFNRMAQTFGMTAEYARLKGETDHNVLPDVGRSLPDQAFDATQDSKKIQVHPTDPKKPLQ
jgi:hypothetical protein